MYLYLFSILLSLLHLLAANGYLRILQHADRKEQRVVGRVQYDCFYMVNTNVRQGENEVIPYCIRPLEVIPHTVPNVSLTEESSIRSIRTFAQLRQQNVTVKDLFHDGASVDICEQYEMYLSSFDVNSTLNKTKLCYCLEGWFGSNCEYKFNSDEKFETIVKERFEAKTESDPRKVVKVTEGTCYTGLTCDRQTCLDWREVCDGKIDCPNAVDEEHCWQMEINECNDDEYRCTNGQCIPLFFFYDKNIDCQDATDEVNHIFKRHECFMDPSSECEDATCPWGQFSCGDGFCREISLALRKDIYADDRKSFCANGRDILFTRNMFESDEGTDQINDLSDDCRISVICALKLYAYFDTDLHEECETVRYYIDKLFQEKCPLRFFFPSVPVLFNHVRFVYTTNKTDWLVNVAPDYICFNEQLCQSFDSTTMINGTTCAEFRDFSPPLYVRYKYWYNLINDIQNMFKACSLPKLNTTTSITSSVCAHPSLFHCNNTTKCISKHRLLDNSIDCYQSSDEQQQIDTCTYKLSNRFQCTTSTTQCIPRRMLRDGGYDCQDASDEHFPIRCNPNFFVSPRCDNVRGTTKLNDTLYFSQICNGIVETTNSDDDTDESNCEQWPCRTRYTMCDNVWNCKNGSDELYCEDSYSTLVCDEFKSHYCLIIDKLEDGVQCLEPQYINEGAMNCIGSTDERQFCRNAYPDNPYQRYRCLNSSLCISPMQLCDCVEDCPFGDDERLVCPWLANDSCKKGQFLCNNSGSIPYNYRCDNDYDCEEREDELFCDLIDASEIKLFTPDNFVHFPLITSIVAKEKLTIQKQYTPTEIELDYHTLWYCNRGIFVQSFYDNNTGYCLCPPAYYGDRCEYQSEHITIKVTVSTITLLEKDYIVLLLFLLIDSTSDIIVSYEYIYHVGDTCDPKYIVYLLYPNPKPIHSNYFIKLEAYTQTMIGNNNHIQYKGSWYFDIPFQFLPVNRLVTAIELLYDIIVSCDSNNITCINGHCLLYVNTGTPFCHCDEGWFGKSCNIKESCECRRGSVCIGRSGNNDFKPICLCSFGNAGQSCKLTYDGCGGDECLHGATCVSVDSRMNSSVCICPEEFTGTSCEHEKAKIHIDFGIPVPSMVLLRLFDTTYEHQVYSTLFKRIPLYQNNILIHLSTSYIPPVNFLQIFNEDNPYEPYYLITLFDDKMFTSQLSTTVVPSNRCPHFSELFNRTVSSDTYLRRVKYYQLPCEQKHVRCFYDENSMCLCNKDNYVECFPYKHELVQCKGISYCQNGTSCSTTT
ncbi:unnamed protein product [Didymodactylos carnosus]|uniref:EGF-like domain-containing protein n=1 Tax=Didymodactylos carnosus TaxID=1234261 RepID=A0A815BTR8_9BILA|nr:unnamed protein product [Didymodactylos carnosus]CAF4071192.1 unnamed protein product [Didymodactylos carnosus]